ncbi:MAG: hypothetical protein ACRDHF_09585, partial [Tepidiformaceae bacterium]
MSIASVISSRSLPGALLVSLVLAAAAHGDGQTGSGDVGREATVRVGYPGKAWRLAIDLPGHRMAPPRIAADNSLLVALGEFGDAGFVVSVTLETLPEAHSARDCIEHYRKLTRGRSAVSRASVKSLGHPVATVVRYTLEGSQDGGFHQKHFNAYLHHDGYCIDVHLSKDACLTHEEARLQDAVRSIRLEPAGEVDAVAPRPPVGARPDGATKRDAGGDSPGLRAFPIHDRPLALVLDARDVVMENSNPRYAFDIRRRRYRGQKVTGWSWWGQRLEGRVSLGVWARIDSDEEHARNWRDRIWPEIDVGLASRPEGVTRGERDGVAWVDYT